MDSGGQSGWMGWIDTALYITLMIRCKYTIHTIHNSQYTCTHYTRKRRERYRIEVGNGIADK